MTNIQILDNDFETIQKYIALGREKFNLTIKVERDIKTPIARQHKPLSHLLDKQIKNAKSVNTKKANTIKLAMEEIHSMLDKDKIHLSVEEAKEQYFTTKANQI